MIAAQAVKCTSDSKSQHYAVTYGDALRMYAARKVSNTLSRSVRRMDRAIQKQIVRIANYE